MAESYWWVNQGKTFAQERRGSFLWAPQHAPNGQTKVFWTRMTKVREGDLILHYAKGIRAVSRATSDGYEAELPSELPSDEWERMGWRVNARYRELHRPIHLNEIPLVWREGTKEEPFNIHGGVKQGYLYPLSRTFVAELRDRFGARIPDV